MFHDKNENFDLSNTNIEISNSATGRSAYSACRYLGVWVFGCLDLPARNSAPSKYAVYKQPQLNRRLFSSAYSQKKLFWPKCKDIIPQEKSLASLGGPGSNRELMTAYFQDISSSLFTKYSSEYIKYVI